MTHSLVLDIADTMRTKRPQKTELVALLSEKYALDTDGGALDRTRLLRIADANDFLSNNLPPAALADLAKG